VKSAADPEHRKVTHVFIHGNFVFATRFKHMRSYAHPINVVESYIGRSKKFLNKPTCCDVKIEAVPVYITCAYVTVLTLRLLMSYIYIWSSYS